MSNNINSLKEDIMKIVASLELRVTHEELVSKSSADKCQSIMTRWMPLAPAILDMVVRIIPSPAAGQAMRFDSVSAQ